MEPTSTERSYTEPDETVIERKSEPTEPIDRATVTGERTASRKDECHIMLAHVNLLRIRRQLTQATEMCEGALRRWPLRPDAHTLLGDLYREDGRIDDAIVRYCRALELDPNSSVNRKKLAEIVQVKRRSLSSTTGEKKQAGGLKLDRLTRSIVLVLATLMLATIMMAPIIFQKRLQLEAADSTNGSIDRTINLDPIILQSPTAPAATAQTLQTAVIRDAVEQSLLDAMNSDKTLSSQNLEVTNVEELPSSGTLAITFLDRLIGATGNSKSAILKNSLLVGILAGEKWTSADVKVIETRCLVPPTTPPATPPLPTATSSDILVFDGQIDRTALQNPGFEIETLTSDSELESCFTSTWWANPSQ